MQLHPIKDSPELTRLLAAAASHEMTPAEIWDQRVSFAYGNASLENARITRQMVVERATELYGPRPSK